MSGTVVNRKSFQKWEDRNMATKKNKGQVQEQKKQEVPNEAEVKKSWLSSYAMPRNTAARVATSELIKGISLTALMEVCKAYNEKQKNGHWGEKLSDLNSHMRWLKAKGYQVIEKDDNYKLSA